MGGGILKTINLTRKMVAKGVSTTLKTAWKYKWEAAGTVIGGPVGLASVYIARKYMEKGENSKNH